jgi:TRAP-type C4-dicarboxylate transport system permease large subunit
VSTEPRESPLRTWLSTVPILLLLLTVLLHGTAEKVHARLLGIGERNWAGYATLRVDPKKPTCDQNAVAAPAAAKAGAAASAPTSGPASKPGVAPASAPGAASAPAAAKAKGDDIDDLFGEDDKVNPEALKAAQEAARKQCADEHAAYAETQKKFTSGLRTFRSVEKGVATLVDLLVGKLQHILVTLLLLAAITTTAIRTHISIRIPRSKLDHALSQLMQLAANTLLLFSSIAQVRVDRASGTQVQYPELPMIWIAGFGIMAVVNVINLLRPPKDATNEKKLSYAMLCPPPWTTLALIAGIYFLLKEGHPSGLAIYLQKLTEHALLYLQVGLYVWVGMMLKRTRIAPLAFDLFRPWKLPPEVLAVLIVGLAAFPTAYSGASGIFVMAAGGIIYTELRKSGARPQLAIATTSMSGALGVSLKPCLLVVIVAAMNKEVTTGQLYARGWTILLVTIAALLVVSLLLRVKDLKNAAPKGAAREFGHAFMGLLPYIVIGGLVLAFYTYGLHTHVDEHSAPAIMPVLLLCLLIYDRRAVRKQVAAATASTDGGVATDDAKKGSGRLLLEASSESAGHTGALLMLMGCSICLGGVVERSDIMSAVAQNLGSPVAAMAILVLVMVCIGMTLDPYGAVILVSVTLAPVAYKNGIDPLHFWTMVLIAFEFGYLTPAIGLNKLLTRRIVEECEPEVLAITEGSFYKRNEGVILNMAILGIMLLVVAFLPFVWK